MDGWMEKWMNEGRKEEWNKYIWMAVDFLRLQQSLLSFHA